jgi:hypothetical protein
MNEAMLQALGPAVPPFINLSSHASSAAGYATQGWSSVGSWQVAFRRLAPRRRHTLAPGQRGQPTPFAVLDIHARGELPGPITVSPRPRPAAMARLAARLSSGAPLGLDRSRRFYAWRYGNPLSQYRILFLGTRRLRGFMALQFSIRSACAAINVVEWEGESARDKALLIEAAMTWGDFESLRIWSASFTPDEQALLARLGFAVVDHAGAAAEGFYCPQILVRPAERGGTRGLARSLGQPAQWQLPGIASDNF